MRGTGGKQPNALPPRLAYRRATTKRQEGHRPKPRRQLTTRSQKPARPRIAADQDRVRDRRAVQQPDRRLAAGVLPQDVVLPVAEIAGADDAPIRPRIITDRDRVR